MLQNELYHTLALLQVDGVGDVFAKKLINHCGSAEAVFQSKNTFSISSKKGFGKIHQIGNRAVGIICPSARKLKATA